jgi:hypothetical protein
MNRPNPNPNPIPHHQQMEPFVGWKAFHSKGIDLNS